MTDAPKRSFVTSARSLLPRALRKYTVLRRWAEAIVGRLESQSSSSSRAGRLTQRILGELERALLPPDFYGSRYFEAKDAGGEHKASGYADYRRETSNLDVAAYILLKHLRPESVLDIGSALGFLIEALTDLDIPSFGIDVSHDAVTRASESVRGRMLVGSAPHLPFRNAVVQVITAIETLEHLPPRLIPTTIRELARVTTGFVVTTIPSFGSNEFGPDGWFSGKVRWEVLDRYEQLGSDYEGPIPFPDLMRDREGNPIEGHLTIASFSWWTKRFEEAGFVRCGDLEGRMNHDLERFGLLGEQIWHLYVFRMPSTEIPATQIISAKEAEAAEKVLNLPAKRNEV